MTEIQGFFSLMELICYATIIMIVGCVVILKIVDKWFKFYHCESCQAKLDYIDKKYKRKDNQCQNL